MGDWLPDQLPVSPVNGEARDQNKSSNPESQDLTWMKTKIRGLISQFLEDIDYNGPVKGDDFDGLLQGMHNQARELGIPYPEGSRPWYCFTVGLHYARFCFPRHPLDLRIHIGIFTWLVTQVDDQAGKDPDEWGQFVSRFHAREPQPSPVARALDANLLGIRTWYEPLVASFIVISTLNFVNATTLEGAVFNSPNWSPTVGAVRWPYFFRDKDGLSEAYSYFTYPRSLYPDVACYVEAVPDMIMYINFVNDIMSFYKEELAGEKSNYMHNRAFAESKDAYQVYETVVGEALELSRRIILVLGGNGKEKYLRAWLDQARGYVTFHRTLERYRLRELGLGESYTD
ncbi:hypothetical protein PG988_010533 [Apiospora saccharicola]